jgi:DUF971 family protein
MDLPTAATQPVEIDLDRQRELRIRWADGAETVLPLPKLRRACPCAACRQEREDHDRGGKLTIVPQRQAADAMVRADTAELVGNYALRIRWADGHDTGIYGFAFLRSIDATQPRP